MYSLKFFFTDPMEMAEKDDTLSECSRIFISGSNLQTQTPGLSESVPYAQWGRVLAQAQPCNEWMLLEENSGMQKILSFPSIEEFGSGGDRVIIGSQGSMDDCSDELRVLLNSDRKQMEPELMAVLAKVDLVLFPIKATGGFDLEIFSSSSIKEPLRSLLTRNPSEEVRRFFLDTHRVRSEQKFHFDLWMIDQLEGLDWLEEV